MSYHAFYSQQAAEKCGGVVEYLTENGEPVVCTFVSETSDGVGYKWPDKVSVGKVEKFNRIINPRKRM